MVMFRQPTTRCLARAASATTALLLLARSVPVLADTDAAESCAASGTCRSQQTAEQAKSNGVLLMQLKPGLLSSAAGSGGAEANKVDLCHFTNKPMTPYYWEPSCKLGGLGCWADGVHAECRYCGEAPYTGIPCPAEAIAPPVSACRYKGKLVNGTKLFFDPTCKKGELGCYADRIHIGCRFCGGEGTYKEIACPAEMCQFGAPPTTPYYWEPDCTMGTRGCMADGIHKECRFCRMRPFEDIPCPPEAAPPLGACWFPNEPTTPYYWDPECDWGILGCWADGINAQCRFCGVGDYASVPCQVVQPAPGRVA